MLTIDPRYFRQAVLVTVMFLTMASPACNVPVFRYALERWETDAYEIVVFHRQPFSAEQQEWWEKLEQAGSDGRANLETTKINSSGEMSETVRKLWNAQANPSLPWMVVKYPRKSGIEPPAWAGPLSTDTVESLLESPARRDIAQKLLSGDAVVWLLLESGDRQRDNETVERVEAELRKLEQTLKLPELSPLDPPVNPDLPLKIAFSTVRIARSDPAERMLANLLLNWNTNRTAALEPMLFPIFGRGRVIPPAIGDEIRPEAIREMAEFLTGPCSCEIKELNPGFDLLLAANWNSLAGYQETLIPEPLPLVGMSQFVANSTNTTTATSAQPAVALASASAATGVAGGGHLVRNVGIVFAVGVVLLAVTTLVLRARTNRQPR